MKSKKLALTGILFALALIIGTIENYIPPIIPFLPFVKIGLSNIVLLFSAITLGFIPTIIISVMKSILVPLMVGNPMMIAYSLPSSLIAIIISLLLIYSKRIGIPTIGVIGAIIHNIVQVLIASLIMQDVYVFGFLPYLILTGFVAGLTTGIITYLLIKYMPKEILN